MGRYVNKWTDRVPIKYIRLDDEEDNDNDQGGNTVLSDLRANCTAYGVITIRTGVQDISIYEIIIQDHIYSAYHCPGYLSALAQAPRVSTEHRTCAFVDLCRMSFEGVKSRSTKLLSASHTGYYKKSLTLRQNAHTLDKQNRYAGAQSAYA